VIRNSLRSNAHIFSTGGIHRESYLEELADEMKTPLRLELRSYIHGINSMELIPWAGEENRRQYFGCFSKESLFYHISG
jgi:hypothetical protein